MKFIEFLSCSAGKLYELQNVWRDSLQWGYPVFCLISKLLNRKSEHIPRSLLQGASNIQLEKLFFANYWSTSMKSVGIVKNYIITG